MAVEIKLPEMKFDVKVNGEKAEVVNSDPSVYINTITEATGVSKQKLKELEHANQEYLREAIKVATKKATEVLKDNNEVSLVDVRIPFGVNKSDYISTHVIREKEYRNPQTGETTKAPAVKVVVHNKYSTVGKSYIKSLKEKIRGELGM